MVKNLKLENYSNEIIMKKKEKVEEYSKKSLRNSKRWGNSGGLKNSKTCLPLTRKRRIKYTETALSLGL